MFVISKAMRLRFFFGSVKKFNLLVRFVSVWFVLVSIGSVWFGSVWYRLKHNSVRSSFLFTVLTEKSVRFGRTAWP